MEIRNFNSTYYIQIKENKTFFLTKAIAPHILKNSFSFVAVENETVMGYIYAEEIQNVKSVLIFAIEVLPNVRNNGIGKMLEKYLEEQCKISNIKSIHLFYHESEHLNEFYKSMNFEGIDKNMKVIIKDLV